MFHIVNIIRQRTFVNLNAFTEAAFAPKGAAYTKRSINIVSSCLKWYGVWRQTSFLASSKILKNHWKKVSINCSSPCWNIRWYLTENITNLQWKPDEIKLNSTHEPHAEGLLNWRIYGLLWCCVSSSDVRSNTKTNLWMGVFFKSFEFILMELDLVCLEASRLIMVSASWLRGLNRTSKRLRCTIELHEY